MAVAGAVMPDCAPDSLIQRLFHYAEIDPHRDAAVSPTVSLSYAKLAELVMLQAARLRDAGITAQIFTQN